MKSKHYTNMFLKNDLLGVQYSILTLLWLQLHKNCYEIIVSFLIQIFCHTSVIFVVEFAILFVKGFCFNFSLIAFC
jgi:hypothetical protein